MNSVETTYDERMSEILHAFIKRDRDGLQAIWESLILERTEHHTWNSYQMECFDEIIDKLDGLILEERE